MRRYWNEFGHLYPDRVKRVFTGPSARPKSWPTQPGIEIASMHQEKTAESAPSGLPIEVTVAEEQVISLTAYAEIMDYDDAQATAYKSIPLAGSTYEVSLQPALSAMGDISQMTVLDFGTGTGRTACALRDQNAGHVLAVDKNLSMLRAATHCPEVTYIQTGHSLPMADSSIDAALCASVFPEFSSLDDIVDVCREINRVLKPGHVFIVVVPNPDSLPCNYVSYRYLPTENLLSGSPISCLIKAPEPFMIQDYYWSSSDYLSALKAAGFIVDKLLTPTAAPDEGQWLDETVVAPDLVIRCLSQPLTADPAITLTT
jgi:toxoflavin synthase